MKKEKVFCLVLSSLILIFLTGCSSKLKTKSYEKQETVSTLTYINSKMSAEDTVKCALDSLVSLDTQQFNEYVNYNYSDTTNGILFKDNILFSDNIDEEEKEMIRGIVSNISYKIKGVIESGDTATVKMQITNRDFSGLWKSLIYEEDEEFVQLINNTKKIKKFDISLSLKRDNGKWKINMSKEFTNAIFGGMFPFLN